MKKCQSHENRFSSIFSRQLEDFIAEKRKSGRVFTRAVYELVKFDDFCRTQHMSEPLLTEDLIAKWNSVTAIFPKTTKECATSAVRGFSVFLNTIHPSSYVIPVQERIYKNHSVIAPLINEFIEFQQKLGKRYKGETYALKSFDCYCFDHKLCSSTEITPKLIEDWYYTTARSKDYRYCIRQFCIYLKTQKQIPITIPPERRKESKLKEEFIFKSVFAKLLIQFVSDKKASGYTYDSEWKILKYFDVMCVEQQIRQPILTKAIVQRWAVQRPSEGSNYRRKRVTIVRQFAKFLISQGLSAYLMQESLSAETTKPHIFKDEEITAFFQELDTYKPKSEYMSLTLPVLFRFYYCLGLRLNEAVCIKRSDLNLTNGAVLLRLGKKQKDRMVYLPEDLKELAITYDRIIEHTVPNRVYFFVSDILGTKVVDTGICRHFNLVWKATGYAEFADKKPTIHCFRHTLVVRKLEQWYRQKVDYSFWLPYLSRHLGHHSLEETYHYVHLVDSSFPEIREAMNTFEELYAEEVRG